MFEVRTATAEDLPTLELALVEADRWERARRDTRPDVAGAMADPALRRALWDPDRDGDVAVVALVDGTGVGGAWARCFATGETHHGFVDEATPVLGIGLAPPWRGRGLGRVLLSALLVEAATAGHERLSLGVARDNPARHLYRQLGFRAIGSAPHDPGLTMVRPTPGGTAHIP